MPVRTKIPLQGEFESSTADYDLPNILLAVCETNGTGLLTFSNPSAEKTLFVRDGNFIFAKSSAIDDRLGEHLLRSGRITLTDLEAVGKLVKPGKRLGTLLVESGVLDPKELVQAVVGQVRFIILSLFKWTQARYEFVIQDLPSKETITLEMPTPQLIVDGIWEIDSWWRISRGIGDLDSIYQAVSGTEGSLRSIELETSGLELLAMLRRPKRVTEVCTDSSLKGLDVCKLLWAFRCLGWVETVDDDGTSLLDQWGMAEDAPASQPEPMSSTSPPAADAQPAPLPALVEPIVESAPVQAVGPVGPVEPVEPIELVEPVELVQPVQPEEPEPAPQIGEQAEALDPDSHPAFPQFSEQTVAIPSLDLLPLEAQPIVPSDVVEDPSPAPGEAGMPSPVPPAEPAEQAEPEPAQVAAELEPALQEAQPEPKSPAPVLGTDMDMDLDMDGLGEVLGGGESE